MERQRVVLGRAASLLTVAPQAPPRVGPTTPPQSRQEDHSRPSKQHSRSVDHHVGAVRPQEAPQGGHFVSWSIRTRFSAHTDNDGRRSNGSEAEKFPLYEFICTRQTQGRISCCNGGVGMTKVPPCLEDRWQPTGRCQTARAASRSIHTIPTGTIAGAVRKTSRTARVMSAAETEAEYCNGRDPRR